jgi:hypothetical protein
VQAHEAARAAVLEAAGAGGVSSGRIKWAASKGGKGGSTIAAPRKVEGSVAAGRAATSSM